jgi:hypothetical protein
MMRGVNKLFLITVFLLSMMLMGNRTVEAQTSDSSPSGVGLQAASWLATIPYGALKSAYALGGGVVGGLAWVVTGGSTTVAKAIWIPAMTGDYIVRPENLTGEKPLRFIGRSDDNPAP